MRWGLILGMILLFILNGYAQSKSLNIPAIHQLVAASKSENALQAEAKNRQAIALANEQQNRTLLAKLKGRYRELQQRYNSLGTLIDAANIGFQASPMVDKIINNQIGIYQLASDNPLYIGLAYQTEIVFVNKARSLVNYLIGLSASIGAVNQMKASDRKLLFDYILSELSDIQEQSQKLYTAMQYSNKSSIVRTLNPFNDYISRDKDIVGDIIENAKYLKP